MKQFIVLMGVLPIMLLFLLQYTLDQKNNRDIALFQDSIYAAKEQAKQAGCFTEQIKRDLTQNLSQNLNIPEDQITMTLTEVPRYRTTVHDERELIHYKVSVPIDQLMAGNHLFGISDEKNRGRYTIESRTASELLP